MNESFASVAAVPAAPAATPAPPAPSEFSLPISTSEAASVAQWIKADLAAGKVTPEEAAKAFDEVGLPMDQRGPDQRSEKQIETDRQFPPAKPHDYLIQYDHLNSDQPIPPEVQALDAAARTWLSEAGFPREIGNSLVKTIDRVGKETAGMSTAQSELYRMSELKKLQHVHGEHLAERLQAADDMLDAVDQQHPGVIDFLDTHGIGRNALVWNALIQQAAIYHARRKG